MSNKSFQMGFRKVQQVRGCFTMNLPIEWCKNFEMQKGDMLKIEMLDDFTLQIKPIKKGN